MEGLYEYYNMETPKFYFQFSFQENVSLFQIVFELCTIASDLSNN